MNLSDTVGFLQDQGWQVCKDEAGDQICTKKLGEKFVLVVPKIKHTKKGQVLSMREAVGTYQFSKVVADIFGRGSNYTLKTRFGADRISECFSSVELELIIKEIVEWAEELNTQSILCQKSKLETNSVGILPLHHLSALAILGNKTKLLEYKKSFESGDRMGFVPYIRVEHINRAIHISEKT